VITSLIERKRVWSPISRAQVRDVIGPTLGMGISLASAPIPPSIPIYLDQGGTTPLVRA
jgi:hypothetical protein